jgi:hypothetical protein
MLDGPQALATEAEPIGRALQAALDRAGGVAERVLKSYNQNTITEPI